MSEAQALIALKGVSKSYRTGEAIVAVLRNIDLCVAPGEALALVGPSGSGKSTLLNIMGALDTPSAGTIHFKDRDLAGCDETQLAELRNRHIGFIFQFHHLLPQCSVLENVMIPTLALNASALRDGAEERAQALLKRVGLQDRLTHRPGQLSGGERQRVAVVRALINQPELLLADEPTGSLDRRTAAALADLLIELPGELNTALVLVTHDLALAQRLPKVVELQDGALVEAAPA